MDFAQGFTLLRELGESARRRRPALRRADGDPRRAPPGRAPRARGHGAAGVAAAWRVASRRSAARHWAGVLALWQLASGLSNVVLGWPLVAALAHTGGAAVWWLLLTLLLRARGRGGRPQRATQTARIGV